MIDWTGEHIGKYHVKKLLGQGGMGQVYQAFHSALERDVALKVIHTRLATDPEAIERFRREAKVVAGLRHPGIIHVYDFDVEGAAFYMVMEFVPGHDLHEHLATLHQWGERLPLNEALRLFRSITEAVAYAHSQEVIHRDLKPSNVLLTADDQPILVDFGLSKLIGADQLTVQGVIMGTPQYMSPEQGTGGAVDARSDVYSLGVMLYELTTGTRPFTSATPVGLILKHVSEPPAPPRSINPNLPEAVEQVIQKALAKDPAERYASAQALLRAVEALLLPPEGDQAETVISFVDDGRCPYRGLQTFEAEHTDFFFGREALVDQFVKQVIQLSQVKGAPSEARFLAVLGASGSGKSSVVRAGLVPALQQQPGAQWVPLVMKPGSRPLEELAAQLASLEAQATDRLATTRRLLNHLSADSRALHLALRLAWAEAPAEQRLLLVVDQFEEIFTLCRDEGERQRFIENLLYAAASQEGRVFVLLTMRADFYHRCAVYRELAGQMSGQQVLVGPMDEVELRRAIERPAETIGLRFEPGLVDTILAEVNQQPGALPLLQHALLELWERRERGLLSLAAYRDSGGVIGAIAQRAETLYNSFNPEEQGVARQVMLRLTQPGEGTEDTRRRARLSEFGVKPSTTSVIQRLTQARLLTISRDAASGEEMVNVAHEALIRGWERLRTWIDEDRTALRTHRRLTEAAEEWERHRRDESYLYQGARLVEAEEWAKSHTEAVNDLERAFVQASVEAREATTRAAQRARRRVVTGLATGLAVVSLCLVASIILGGTALMQWRTAEAQRLEAERQSRLAQARAVAAYARNVLDDNPQTATLLALVAQSIAPNNEAMHVLAEAPYRYPPISATLTEHTGWINSVAYSPDGTLLASGSGEEVIIWDAATGQPLNIFKTKSVMSVAFSPDGTLLALAGALEDNKIIIWEVSALRETGAASDKPLMTFTGHTGFVFSVAFSPDGTRLASGSDDHTVILWDVSTLLDSKLGQDKGTHVTSSQPLATFTGHTSGVNSVAFSPDGTLLASGETNATIILWEVTTGKPVTTLKGPLDRIESVAFNPDGSQLASGTTGNTIIIWDVASGQLRTTLKGHGRDVTGVAFSPDGTRLASGSDDNTVMIWDVATGQPTATFKAHLGIDLSVAFSPDGNQLASGSADNTIILWDVSSDPALTTLTGHEEIVESVAFSPDGSLLASGGGDGDIILWDVPTGQPHITFWESTFNSVTGLVFNPEGTLLASSTDQATWVSVWDTATGQRVLTLTADIEINGTIYKTAVGQDVAFSPDGTKLASGGPGIPIWDIATGRLITILGDRTADMTSVAFSPDGTLLASGIGDSTIVLWNLSTGQPVMTLKGHARPVPSLAFSPDGTLLASAGGDGTLILWDVATGQHLTTLKGHTGAVYDVAFHPDGKIVASGASDRLVIFWDVDTHQGLTTLKGHNEGVTSVAFSPDGTKLASGSRDHQVLLLDEKFFQAPCHWVTRNLWPGEWKSYVSPDLPYQEVCPGLPVPGGLSN